MTTPTFTIITVTWNAASVLKPTLDSIRSQTCTDYEYLVMDGASSDDTLAMIQESGIASVRVTSEPDSGLYDAMNKAIAAATGRYLIFLNAGDSFADDTSLARIAVAAEQSPGVIYGQTQIVDSNRRVFAQRHLRAPKHLTVDSFARGMVVCHQAFVARRDLVPQYNLQYRYSADYDWCIRVLQQSAGNNAYVGNDPIISFLSDGMTDQHRWASLRERYRIMCHYYGTWPTIARHISFIPRFIVRRIYERIKK